LNQLIKENENGSLKLLITNSPPWVLATVAEAFFGLQQYDKALIFINQYLELQKNKPWEIRSFSKQMFSIAYLQNYCKNFSKNYDKANKKMSAELKTLTQSIDLLKIDKCLDPFRLVAQSIEDKSAAEKGQNAGLQEIKKEGKTGLALSGGGFRSAMFHIGVLAALAEKDELKSIEVISCVSGGSIIGAFYYLKLKDLMERKTDDQINREDYIKIVKDIELTFVSATLFATLKCLKRIIHVHTGWVSCMKNTCLKGC
jgi:predicted acylesterase/phospholipase RssA